MTWGLPTPIFLDLHVILSLIGIASGLIVFYGLLTSERYPLLTALFLLTTILTSVTGFPLAPFGFDPPRAVGTLSLVLLAAAVAALYVFDLRGFWRGIYVATAVAALYLNVFVGVVQSFQKLAFFNSLAPTQTEPPFIIAQGVVLGLFVTVRHCLRDRGSTHSQGQHKRRASFKAEENRMPRVLCFTGANERYGGRNAPPILLPGKIYDFNLRDSNALTQTSRHDISRLPIRFGIRGANLKF